MKHSFDKLLADNGISDRHSDLQRECVDKIVLNLRSLWTCRNGKNDKKIYAFIYAIFSILFQTLDKENNNGR